MLPDDPPPVLRPVVFDTVYGKSEVDRPPELKKGVHHLLRRMRYPSGALDRGISGRVVVRVIVSPSGEPTNIAVSESVHPLLDNEARRVMLGAEYIPGKKDGKPVPVELMLPLTFRTKKGRENSFQ